MSSFSIAQDEEGVRLDKLLAQRFSSYSRAYFQYLIEAGSVLVNGKISKKRELLKEHDEVEVYFILTPELSLEPEEIPLDILYEDEDLLVINKPAGMVVHPAPGHPSKTFANALLFHCSRLSLEGPFQGSLRPGIVHRLDKETSGLLLAAKNLETHGKLVSSFACREIQKHYLAICFGNPGTVTIDAPIGRHPIDRKKMAIREEGGRAALSECRTLAHHSPFSLVEIRLITGRTHQIRVHLKHIHCPVLGDPTYGSPSLNRKYNATRQLLHAHRLSFKHPRSQSLIELSAPPPPDMSPWIPDPLTI
jgi:23S rRNA pseudouridine1911/1915/1917 synthase